MRALILSIIRMREYLLKEGKGGKNVMLCHQYLRKTKAWLSAYPRATERQVRNYAKRHLQQLLYLTPSSTNPAHLSIIEKPKSLSDEPAT